MTTINVRVFYILINEKKEVVGRPSSVVVPQNEVVDGLLAAIKAADREILQGVAHRDLCVWKCKDAFLVKDSPRSLHNRIGTVDFSKQSPDVELIEKPWTTMAELGPKALELLLVQVTISNASPESKFEKRLPMLSKKIATSPSGLASMTPSQVAKLCKDFFIYNLPRETDSTPLALQSEIFGRFQDDCKHELDPSMADEFRAALHLAETLCEPQSETSLQGYVKSCFSKLFAMEFEYNIEDFTSDGHVCANGRLFFLVEGKTRLPEGDARAQGMAYYREFWLSPTRRTELLKYVADDDVLPAFLLTYQGPLITVYALALVGAGKVQCEFLVSVNADCHWTNDEELCKLARVLWALRKAFASLRKPSVPSLLSSLDDGRPSKRQRGHEDERVVWPYPRAFKEIGSGKNVNFEYRMQMPGQRHLFLAEDCTSRFIVVKFTRRYGREVHEVLAEEKLAPQLFGFQDNLPGGWKMIVMELLDLETDGWTVGHLVENSTVVNHIEDLHKILALLKEHNFVHGDIQLPNLLFRDGGTGKSDCPAVQLIDFDFSGKAGEGTYPLNLNTSGRPRNQCPGGTLAIEHDEAMVKEIELSLNVLPDGKGVYF